MHEFEGRKTEMMRGDTNVQCHMVRNGFPLLPLALIMICVRVLTTA